MHPHAVLVMHSRKHTYTVQLKLWHSALWSWQKVNKTAAWLNQKGMLHAIQCARGGEEALKARIKRASIVARSTYSPSKEKDKKLRVWSSSSSNKFQHVNAGTLCRPRWMGFGERTDESSATGTWRLRLRGRSGSGGSGVRGQENLLCVDPRQRPWRRQKDQGKIWKRVHHHE